MEKSWEKTLRASFSWNEVTFPFSILSRRNVIKKKKEIQLHKSVEFGKQNNSRKQP